MYREKLRRIRMGKGIPQEYIARKVGVGISMVSMIENGLRNMQVPMFKVWCKALGVTYGEVLDEEEKVDEQH